MRSRTVEVLCDTIAVIQHDLARSRVAPAGELKGREGDVLEVRIADDAHHHMPRRGAHVPERVIHGRLLDCADVGQGGDGRKERWIELSDGHDDVWWRRGLLLKGKSGQ